MMITWTLKCMFVFAYMWAYMCLCLWVHMRIPEVDIDCLLDCRVLFTEARFPTEPGTYQFI